MQIQISREFFLLFLLKSFALNKSHLDFLLFRFRIFYATLVVVSVALIGRRPTP